MCDKCGAAFTLINRRVSIFYGGDTGPCWYKVMYAVQQLSWELMNICGDYRHLDIEAELVILIDMLLHAFKLASKAIIQVALSCHCSTTVVGVEMWCVASVVTAPL